MEVDTVSNMYMLNRAFSALMYMQVINMDMLFRNILLAEFTWFNEQKYSSKIPCKEKGE